MSIYLYRGLSLSKVVLGAMIVSLSTLSGCWSKEGDAGERGVTTPPQAASAALTSPQAGQPVPAPSNQDGGDRLPLKVDPNSPGSCALLHKDEFCGQCCSDVFPEDSDPWHLCMDACVKADALRNER
jgi:hypothetical protein